MATDPSPADLGQQWREQHDRLPSQSGFTGQIAVAFNLASGVGAQTTVDVGMDLSKVTFQVLGAPNYDGGTIAGQDQVSWAWRYLGGSQIEVSLFNPTALNVAGTFYGTVHLG